MPETELGDLWGMARKKSPPGIKVKQVRAADLRAGDVIRWNRPTGTQMPWVEVAASPQKVEHRLRVAIRYSTGLVSHTDFQLHQLVEYQEAY